ncbi:Protein tramtrack, beta isoform [Eumeta japonica]|uniref:Protein tramtrack, beta isoform n=1 Tax=Eumeta variegata TaxID=151549 RepID=A0A4C1Z3D1_EUMVA|nr:Protein tramtrack, beta isoform [Eumeta japonica]
MGSEHYCLRWNNHQSNLLGVFSQLLQDESLVDVTLACSEGVSIRAHKVVLSACSSYFRSLFVDHPSRHPIVILKDVGVDELRTLVDFMYKGEVNVQYCQLPALLKTAESLQVKGLAEMTTLSAAGIDTRNVPEPMEECQPSETRESRVQKTVDARDAREKEGRDDRNELRETRDRSDVREVRDIKDTRELRDSREMRECRDSRDGRDHRELRENRELRDAKEPREFREFRESREIRDLREPREPRDLRECREPRDLRESRELRDTREAPEASPPRMSPLLAVRRFRPETSIEIPIATHLPIPKDEPPDEHMRPSSPEDDTASIRSNGTHSENIGSCSFGIYVFTWLSAGRRLLTTITSDAMTMSGIDGLVCTVRLKVDLRADFNTSPHCAVVMRDFNAKLRKQIDDELEIGNFGIGRSNFDKRLLKECSSAEAKGLNMTINSHGSSALLAARYSPVEQRHNVLNPLAHPGLSLPVLSLASPRNEPIAGPSGLPPVQQVPLSLKKEVDWDRGSEEKCGESSSDYRLQHESEYDGAGGRGRVEEGERAYPCIHCGATFPHRNKLTRHILTTHTLDTLKYREAVLGRPLVPIVGQFEGYLPAPDDPADLELAAAAAAAEPGNVVLCKFCGKSFPDVSSLIAHLPVHTGDRPFKCEFCGKAFKLRHHMKDHCRVHTGERPFRCVLCGKTFSRSTILKAHEKTHYPKYARKFLSPSPVDTEEESPHQ